MNITPLIDRVVILPIDDKPGLVEVVRGEEKRPTRGEVLAVGPGRIEAGELVPMSVSVGDVVVYRDFSGAEVEDEGKKYLVMHEHEILGIVVI